MTDDQTSTVRGDAELIARAGHLFDVVHQEFVCAARDLATWSQPQARSAVARRVHAPGTDGFTVRKLWSPLALADEAQRAHLQRLDAAGAQVRISSAPLPHETIILDQRVAILAGQPSPLGREYTVTTSPVLVGGVYSLFTAAWEAAIDLSSYLRVEVPDLAPGDRGARRGPHRRGGRPASGHLATHLPAAGRRTDDRARGRLPLPGRGTGRRTRPSPLTHPSSAPGRAGMVEMSRPIIRLAPATYRAKLYAQGLFFQPYGSSAAKLCSHQPSSACCPSTVSWVRADII